MAKPKSQKDNDAPKQKMKGIFSGIQTFKKDELKPTETVVRHIVSIVDKSGGAGPDSALNEEEIKEYYDSEQELQQKAKQFAAMLQASKYTVVHTGAGISTAAKLPDYRGPQGVWTLRSKGYEPSFSITLEQAKPTYSHMALVKLREKGLLHFVVSTNVDGLHRRSGFGKDEMSELHGNGFKEYCEKCGAEYIRAFDVTLKRIERHTGRLCQQQQCDGKLKDSIINFGENLPEHELDKATEHTAKAELVVMLGSSMRVSPACNIPELCYARKQSPGKFVLVNLQKTGYDYHAEASGGFRVGSKIDDFFRLVMQELKLEVDAFTDDKMIASITEEMKQIKIDPNFRLYNIVKNKDVDANTK